VLRVVTPNRLRALGGATSPPILPPPPSQTVRAVPLASLFAVEARDRYVGFRSLGAEGRLLQAVRGSSYPHRVANHNFGSWESWRACPSHGLVNVAFDKPLGWSVVEVRAAPRSAFREAEAERARGRRAALERTDSARKEARSATRRLERDNHDLQVLLAETEERALRAEAGQGEARGQVRALRARADAAERDLRTAQAALQEMTQRVGELAAERDRLRAQLDRAAGGAGDPSLRAPAPVPALPLSGAGRSEGPGTVERIRDREANVTRFREELEAINSLRPGGRDPASHPQSPVGAGLSPAPGAPAGAPESPRTPRGYPEVPVPRRPPQAQPQDARPKLLPIGLDPLGDMLASIGLAQPTPERYREGCDTPPMKFTAGGDLRFRRGLANESASGAPEAPGGGAAGDAGGVTLTPSPAPTPEAAPDASPCGPEPQPKLSVVALVRNSNRQRGSRDTRDTARDSLDAAAAAASPSPVRGATASPRQAPSPGATEEVGEEEVFQDASDVWADQDAAPARAEEGASHQFEDLNGMLGWGEPPRPKPIEGPKLGGRRGRKAPPAPIDASRADEGEPSLRDSLVFGSPQAALSPTGSDQENGWRNVGLSPSDAVHVMGRPGSPGDAQAVANLMASPTTYLSPSRDDPHGRASPFRKSRKQALFGEPAENRVSVRVDDTDDGQESAGGLRGSHNSRAASSAREAGSLAIGRRPTASHQEGGPRKLPKSSLFLARSPLQQIEDLDLYGNYHKAGQ